MLLIHSAVNEKLGLGLSVDLYSQKRYLSRVKIVVSFNQSIHVFPANSIYGAQMPTEALIRLANLGAILYPILTLVIKWEFH